MNLFYVSQDFFFLKSNLIHLVGGVSVPSVPTLWGLHLCTCFPSPIYPLSPPIVPPSMVTLPSIVLKFTHHLPNSWKEAIL